MPDDDDPRDYASPACMAGEVAPDYFDPLAIDETAARDAARWRKSERERLLSERRAVSQDDARLFDQLVAQQLDLVMAERFGGGSGFTIAGYWPIRGEIDLRDWLLRQAKRNIGIALPVVQAKDMPLIFRPWHPDMPMRAGMWNIPEPDIDETVQPNIMLAPLVGWDSQRYRMGYGGGFYDRTLAALRPKPYAIGIGVSSARLDSIYPQPHDMPLDLIVTEDGPV